jgi:hypothetical protein
MGLLFSHNLVACDAATFLTDENFVAYGTDRFESVHLHQIRHGWVSLKRANCFRLAFENFKRAKLRVYRNPSLLSH